MSTACGADRKSEWVVGEDAGVLHPQAALWGSHVLSVREILEKPIEPFPPGRLKDSRFELVVMAMMDRDPSRLTTISNT